MRKARKWTIRISAAIVISLNIIAYNHAWEFTHFDKRNLAQTKIFGNLTPTEKLSTLLFGISNPRPVNAILPEQPYKTFVLQGNRKIELWVIEPSGNSKGTIILFHGYRGSKSGLIDKSTVFLKLGYKTILVDFYGSGGSAGSETTIGYKEAQDVKAAFDYVTGSGEKSVYLFGTSMGAVAILKAIADIGITPSGIIIECPFGTLYQTTVNRFRLMHVPAVPLASLLVFWGGIQNGYWGFSHNPEDYAKKVNCPALLFYGEKDDRVTSAEINAIYRNLNGQKYLVTFKETGHENYLTKYSKEWSKAIVSFITK